MERESNYEKFKQDALKLFGTFDQENIIRRLSLDHDDCYIYLTFCSDRYRICRISPTMERILTKESGEAIYEEAGCEEVLSICDLLCHTEKPIHLSGNYKTLEGLSRLQSGYSNTLGRGFFQKTAAFFDDKTEQLRTACEKLNGILAGKGDVAYRIPLYQEICIGFQYYQSDEEFDASITLFFDADICEYLHYETLYYVANHVFAKLISLM